MASLPPWIAMVGGSGREFVVDGPDSFGIVMDGAFGSWGGNFDEYQDDNGIDDGGVNDKNGWYGPMQ